MSRLADYFEYLDELRESGVTNMFGAGPYLSREFGLEKAEASKIVQSWMKTFSHDKTPEQRAAGAEP